MHPKIKLHDMYHARKRINQFVRTTPLVPSESLSSICDADVSLKLENLQVTGSFKFRGATNAVRSLTDEQRKNGIVGFSTGNHGRGLAHAARLAGVKCVICMSELVPQNKVEGIRAQGAEVSILGKSQDDAEVEVERLVKEEGMTLLPPFDHADIIAGQGTIALELIEQASQIDSILVPVSGGGLISGIATVLKTVNPDIKVIGVSMERGAAMYECIQAGKPILVEELPTLADSLGGGIGLANQYTFSITRDLVDDIVLVNEGDIAKAIRHAYWQEKQIIEGSGSVGVAALLSKKFKPAGNCVALVSGCNLDMKLHNRIINGENVKV